MADDYISRQAAIKAVNSYLHFAEWKPKIKEVLEMAVYDCSRTLEQLPPADVKPVIRCKDCDWWTKQENSLQGRCARYGIYPTGEWFCAGADMRGTDDA